MSSPVALLPDGSNYTHLNRIQCVYTWFMTQPGPDQRDIRARMLRAESEFHVLTPYGVIVGDLTAAITLGATLEIPRHVVDFSMHEKPQSLVFVPEK